MQRPTAQTRMNRRHARTVIAVLATAAILRQYSTRALISSAPQLLPASTQKVAMRNIAAPPRRVRNAPTGHPSFSRRGHRYLTGLPLPR